MEKVIFAKYYCNARRYGMVQGKDIFFCGIGFLAVILSFWDY